MIEEKYMWQCLELAKKGHPNVAPNPMVGAVIVYNGEVIGSGYHQKYGEAHAEVNAIKSVKNQSLLKEATIYVNLEPCSHYGKTPPCAKLLIEKGIKNVVVANKDPFPEVSGRGINMLREAGINVSVGMLEKEAWHLNREFFTFHIKHRPYVTLKWAQSEDNFIDTLRSDDRISPFLFSTKETLIERDRLRGVKSAILVGTHTALMDNPTLISTSGKSPVRILIDRDLQVPTDFNIYNSLSKTIVFTEKKPQSVSNAEFITLPFDGPNKTINLKTMLSVLYEKKLQTLLVEGGASIHKSFLDNDLWDDLRVEVAKGIFLNNGIKAPIELDFSQIEKTTFGSNNIYYKEKINYIEKTIDELMR